MTAIEEGLQKALDENPADGLLRLILADHLEEIGDPRAAGYREIGRLGVRPIYLGDYPEIADWCWQWWEVGYCRLPWRSRLEQSPNNKWFASSRKEVEDNAALAFLELAR